MLLKAKYEDIDSLGDYLINEADELNKTIDSMISKIDSLGNFWSGPDYENYKEVYKTYLLNTKTSSIELNAFGNAIKRVSYYYGEVDMDFGMKMRKIGVLYDDERK